MVGYQRPHSFAEILGVLADEEFDVIFIAIDGAKDDSDTELKVRNNEIRKIAENFASEHPGRVQVLLQRRNVGITRNFLESISLAFRDVEHLCVLEDDCVPSQGFSNYINSVLSKEVSPKALLISLYRPDLVGLPAQAFYTHCPLMWGWVISRKSWLKLLKEILRLSDESPLLLNPRLLYQGFFFSGFFRVISGKKDALDNLFAYVFLVCDYLTLVPPINLVSNVGTGEFATNTIHDGFMFNTATENWNSQSLLKIPTKERTSLLDFKLYSKMTNWKFHHLLSSYFKVKVHSQKSLTRFRNESLELSALIRTLIASMKTIK